MRILSRLSLIFALIVLGTVMLAPIVPLVDKGYRHEDKQAATGEFVNVV
jgi:hypothetical protein